MRTPLSMRSPAVYNLALGLLIVSPLIVYIFAVYLPYTVDWYDNFGLVALTPLAPYQVNTYFNPPWFALVLAPLGLLPFRIGQAINSFLNLAITALVVARYGGKRWSLVLTLTSLPFAALLLNGNVEWISMSAFLLPAQWGLIFISAKPQTGGLAALLWFKQAPNKLRFLLPLAIIIGTSLLIWRGWPTSMLANIAHAPPESIKDPNVSPWPWLIPIGLWLLYLAWRQDDVLLAVSATFCLVPYFIIHTVTILFALLSTRHLRTSIVVWIFLWTFAVIKSWHLLFPSMAASSHTP